MALSCLQGSWCVLSRCVCRPRRCCRSSWSFPSGALQILTHPEYFQGSLWYRNSGVCPLLIFHRAKQRSPYFLLPWLPSELQAHWLHGCSHRSYPMSHHQCSALSFPRSGYSRFQGLSRSRHTGQQQCFSSALTPHSQSSVSAAFRNRQPSHHSLSYHRIYPATAQPCLIWNRTHHNSRVHPYPQVPVRSPHPVFHGILLLQTARILFFQERYIHILWMDRSARRRAVRSHCPVFQYIHPKIWSY